MSQAMEDALRVLIVDDDRVDRMAVRRALRASGERCEIHEADDVDSALDALRRNGLDCVFLDYQIPGGDGLEVLRRAREAGIATPVVMLTGYGDEQVAVELMKAGASDYLSKNALTPERLQRSLRYVLRVRAAEAVARRSVSQLRGLTEAALAINATLDVPAMLRAATEHARRLLGARFAAIIVGAPYPSEHAALSSDDARWQAREPGPALRAVHALADRARGTGAPVRIGRAKLGADPLWRELVLVPIDHPLRAGFMSARLSARQGFAFGAICVAERADGDLDDADEAILVQLAQLVASALENARLYAQAQAAARARDDILAVVSHDLRNPVGAIQMAADFLIGTAPPDDRRRAARRQLEVIRRGAVSALRLIQDLLDVTRIETGHLVLERAAADARAMVHEAAETVAPLAQTEGITVVERAPGPLPLVLADAERIQQALGNLLGNALKFTPQGGRVTIGAEHHASPAAAGAVRFYVSDTGCGIAPADLPHIFDRFWQGPTGERRGAGLGLAIVRGIVEAHGGHVWAESRPGAGTTVSFIIPELVRPSA